MTPYRSHAFLSEAQLDAELELERVIGVVWRIEAQHRVGSQAQVGLAVKRVQVLDIGADHKTYRFLIP
jgi:phage FluMu protein gp41